MADAGSQERRKSGSARPPKSLALPAIPEWNKRLEWIRTELFWNIAYAEMSAALRAAGLDKGKGGSSNDIKELERGAKSLTLDVAGAYAKASRVPLDWILLGKRLTPANAYVIEQVRSVLDRLEDELVMEVLTVADVEIQPDPGEDLPD